MHSGVTAGWIASPGSCSDLHLHASTSKAACSTRKDSERQSLNSSGRNTHSMSGGGAHRWEHGAMHAPQRRAYACRIRWIINADPCKCRLSEPVMRIHRAVHAVCRAKRSLQPFARACAAGPAPPHRRRLPSALPSSSFRTHAPAHTWSWRLQGIEPSGSKPLLQRTLP